MDVYSETPIRVTLPIDVERARRQAKVKAAPTKRAAASTSTQEEGGPEPKAKPQRKPRAAADRVGERKPTELGNLLFPDGL